MIAAIWVWYELRDAGGSRSGEGGVYGASGRPRNHRRLLRRQTVRLHVELQTTTTRHQGHLGFCYLFFFF